MVSSITQGRLCMQDNAKKDRIAPLRKIIIIVFLPFITFIWMTGWILTQIGNPGELVENNKETLKIYHKFETHLKEPEPDEDPRMANEPPIVA